MASHLDRQAFFWRLKKNKTFFLTQLSVPVIKHSLSKTLCSASISTQSRRSLRMERFLMQPLKFSRVNNEPLDAISKSFFLFFLFCKIIFLFWVFSRLTWYTAYV